MVPRPIAHLPSIILVVSIFAITLGQQPPRTIAKIEIEGLQRQSAAEVIATSGLKAGTVFSVEELDAAGQRLADSGLFANVSYRTITKDNQLTIIFRVEEARSGQSPVAFDNFVWFSNDELMAAIKREVPSFNGDAPNAGRMTDDIKLALQNLLKERGIDGTVEYAPFVSGGKQEYLFSVAGVSIPICSLHFPGARNVSEEKLVKAAKQMTDADYSRSSAIAFSTFILFPLYREAGQLRAKFAEPVATLPAAEKCKRGVEVNIPVEEGPIYLWEKAEWTGNETVTPNELNEVLGMKNGELANGVKIDKRLLEIGKLYGRTGHLDLSLRADAEFDDAASRVIYKIALKEGPQYRMGRLTIKGLNESDARSLEQKWKLKGGEVMDTSYLERFFKTDVSEEIQRLIATRRAAGKGPPDIKEEITPNKQTLTADVIIEFKD
ncbi:MAG TPA: POTRA domain-containing protein [Pyrinomonadaceae bacterium]|jgi:outer membrane protein insertion porin family|nr:POTRA domain-containing protein [Pyrinomonadaceae bacterium]